MSVIIGSLKGTDKYINKIPGNPNQYEIQKVTLCVSANLLRRLISMWMRK